MPESFIDFIGILDEVQCHYGILVSL